MGQEEDFYTMVRTHNKVELLHEENAEYRGERRGFWPSQWKRKKYKKKTFISTLLTQQGKNLLVMSSVDIITISTYRVIFDNLH